MRVHLALEQAGGENITRSFWKKPPRTAAEKGLHASGHTIESRDILADGAISKAYNKIGTVARMVTSNTEVPLLRTSKGLALCHISRKPDGLHLEWMAALDKGAGRAAMEHICKIADQYGVTLTGEPAPHDPAGPSPAVSRSAAAPGRAQDPRCAG